MHSIEKQKNENYGAQSHMGFPVVIVLFDLHRLGFEIARQKFK